MKFVAEVFPGHEHSEESFCGHYFVLRAPKVRPQVFEKRLAKSFPENHPVLDPNLSGRQSDTWMIDLPMNLKERVRQTVRSFIAPWAGISEEDLRPTAFYGPRLYHNGSVLHMHLDRYHTHVLSAIVEVDHLLGSGHPGLAEGGGSPEEEERWPLHILDHSGQEHVIPNRVGQLILYESATCAHGRPAPFRGRELVNVFVHFAPPGWNPQIPGKGKSKPPPRESMWKQAKQAMRDALRGRHEI